MTVPELRFRLRERPLEALEVPESLRRCRQGWRCSSDGVVGEEAGVEVEWDRLADRLRERVVRIRAKMVVSDAVIRAYCGLGEPGDEDVVVDEGENGVWGASVLARFNDGLGSAEMGDVDDIVQAGEVSN